MGIGVLRRYHQRPKTESKLEQEAEPKPVVPVPDGRFTKKVKDHTSFKMNKIRPSDE